MWDRAVEGTGGTFSFDVSASLVVFVRLGPESELRRTDDRTGDPVWTGPSSLGSSSMMGSALKLADGGGARTSGKGIVEA